MGRLSGKVAIVTGAARGTGAETARLFVEEGARVCLADVLDERGAAHAAELGPSAFFQRLDVRREADWAAALAAVHERFGPVDVLVGFHGYVPTTHVRDVSVEEWDRTFAVNVRGTMLCCQAVARQLIERGARGSLVNVSSGASTSARAGGAHYCGSKAAVNMLTEVLAIELGPHGIRVNAVAPGLVMDTVARKGEPTAHPYVTDMLAATPMGRTGAPEDIASAVLFLASDRAGWVTGEVLYVTGGTHCGRPHMAVARGV